MNTPTEADIQRELAQLATLRDAIATAIVGQQDVVEQLLIALLAGGHCLLEGVPGLGKTLLVRSLGQALDLQFRRVQFTPDLMPSDILGTEILEEDHGTGHRMFKFQRGPVFTNLLLADELNRTPPKTQAALLEAMQERTVSYAGVTHALPAPFFVLATQNPLEQSGTYPLPEAQLDRFLLHVKVDYPDEAEERTIIEQTTGRPQPEVPRVMHGEAILGLQARVREVHLGDELLTWITRLVRATRDHPDLQLGASPRASVALYRAAQASAFLAGRDFALPDDVADIAGAVLGHRLVVDVDRELRGATAAEALAEILSQVSVGVGAGIG